MCQHNIHREPEIKVAHTCWGHHHMSMRHLPGFCNEIRSHLSMSERFHHLSALQRIIPYPSSLPAIVILVADMLRSMVLVLLPLGTVLESQRPYGTIQSGDLQCSVVFPQNPEDEQHMLSEHVLFPYSGPHVSGTAVESSGVSSGKQNCV